MLTRRAKAYSSSCSQTVSLSTAISSQFIFRVCAAAEDRKNQLKTLILKVQGLSKSPMFIGSMPMLYAIVFTNDWPTTV